MAARTLERRLWQPSNNEADWTNHRRLCRRVQSFSPELMQLSETLKLRSEDLSRWKHGETEKKKKSERLNHRSFITFIIYLHFLSAPHQRARAERGEESQHESREETKTESGKTENTKTQS